MPIPRTAPEILEREFLDVRAWLLQVGAALDRVDRASGTVDDDARMGKLRQALQALADGESDRAERLQLIFSIPYDDAWRRKCGV